MKQDKIRKRVSYSFWGNIIKAIDSPSNAQLICSEIYNKMNSRMLFNTVQQSAWDKESMELALSDFKSGLLV